MVTESMKPGTNEHFNLMKTCVLTNIDIAKQDKIS